MNEQRYTGGSVQRTGKEYHPQKVKEISIEKGKKSILQVIFGRTGILLVCFLIQMIMIGIMFRFLARYVYWFFGGQMLFGLFLLILILNRMDNPAFQLSWAAIVLLFPITGGLLYLYVELQPGTKVLGGRIAEIDRITKDHLKQEPEVMQRLARRDYRTAQLARYIWETERYPVYENTELTYFPSGEAKFEELKKQLMQAERFIFLEYFILSEGYMWDCIEEILTAKVKEGVEVRVMYDGMNHLSDLPPRFAERLKGEGIHCRVFSPVYPVISTHYNNRDHRKIVVIDGHTAFTGGVNLADEYINRKERFGHWKDAALMLQGEAVKSFTVMFLRMWDIPEKIENMARYTQNVQTIERKSKCFVMPYPANPLAPERTAERIYIEILNSAQRYVHIMTPYLVPGHEMMQALIYAARRGVDVKIILPHIPDKKYAFALAHSYYKKLIQSGVHIYEYTPGFLHSKVFVSDDIRAVVGSVNLDYRSLYLNFECAVFLYEAEEIDQIAQDVRTMLPKCQLMTLFDVRHDKWTRKLSGKMLKLVAPLM